jgi:hypothetical protein
VEGHSVPAGCSLTLQPRSQAPQLSSSIRLVVFVPAAGVFVPVKD